MTGASGRIGRRLVQRLQREGVRVRALVRPQSSVGDELADAEILRGDILDAEAVRAAVAGCSHVFHLAAWVSDDPAGGVLWRSNVEAVETVARQCLSHGVERLVFTSSCSVYGRTVSRVELDEDSPPMPDGPYSRSKLAAERLLMGLFREQNLPVVIVRTSNVLPPDAQDWRELYRKVSQQRFVMLGRGTGLRVATDIDDFVDGLIRCARSPGIEGEIFNIAGFEPVSLRTWVDIFAEAAGVPPPGSRLPQWPLQLFAVGNRLLFRLSGKRLPRSDRLALFVDNRTFRIDKAREKLGYRPQVESRSVLRAMAYELRRAEAGGGAVAPR